VILEVRSRLADTGFVIEVDGRDYRIDYPEWVWKSTPEAAARFLLDNLAYSCTMHLPMSIPGVDGLSFDTARPCFEPYFFQNFVRDIPSCADMDGRDIAAETTRFLAVDYRFAEDPVRLPSGLPPGLPAGVPASDHRAASVVPMSFGKDSLLTWAIADELGLSPLPVYVVEPSFGQERAHKIALGKRFASHFGTELETIEHETGVLRDAAHFGAPRSEYGWGLQSTEYALLMIPYAFATGAGYIFFGNEQSAGSSYRDSTGSSIVYPCYDQTHFWTQHIDAMTALSSGGKVRTGSLIEPLMDVMVQRILVHRYPRHAPYQMSCFAEGEAGLTSRWCHDCSICAKMYLLCRAANVDPYAVGFDRSMLTDAAVGHIPLLDGSSSFPYSRTDLARDEQLFAFLCADRFGADEPLVRRFAGSPLADEARRREGELFARFCSLYDPVSTPTPLRDDVMHLFREEIDTFSREYHQA
jgi:hypothetical protein